MTILQLRRWLSMLAAVGAGGVNLWLPGGVNLWLPGWIPLAAVAPVERLNPVVLFVADGVRQDMVKEMIAEGKLPNYKKVFDNGVDAGEGLIPVLPAVTAPNWATLATGRSPGIHGATCNWFHDNRKPFSLVGVSGFKPFSHTGDTIAKVAARNGLTVVSAGWKTMKLVQVERGAGFDITPIVLSDHGIIANYDLTTKLIWVCTPGLVDRRVRLQPATGWENVPTSFSPAMETSFKMEDQLEFDVYIYDSTNDRETNYDQVLVSRNRDGTAGVATLEAGQWSDSITALAGLRQGQFYVKLIDLEPDLSKFRLFFTALTRLKTRPYDLAADLMARFDGVIMWYDYCHLWTGLVDEDTFVEQILMWQEVVGEQILPYLIEVYQPDLVMTGTPCTDIIQHRFFGRAMSDGDDAGIARERIERAFKGADRMLGKLMELLPSANFITTSDHGFTAVTQTLSPDIILEQAGLYDPRNRRGSFAVGYGTGNGGCAHIYVNLVGRNPGGVVPPESYEAARNAIVQAFQPFVPDLIERIILKEDTAAIPTGVGVQMNMLNDKTTGDVVLFAAPGSSFNPPHDEDSGVGETLAGDHGYIPNGDPEHYAVFAAAGPDIVPGRVIDRVSALDVAPTVARALGIAPPDGVEGRVLPIFFTNKKGQND